MIRLAQYEVLGCKLGNSNDPLIESSSFIYCVLVTVICASGLTTNLA